MARGLGGQPLAQEVHHVLPVVQELGFSRSVDVSELSPTEQRKLHLFPVLVQVWINHDNLMIKVVVVHEHEELMVLTELFHRFKIALVFDEKKGPKEIITRIDLIDYISTGAKN